MKIIIIVIFILVLLSVLVLIKLKCYNHSKNNSNSLENFNEGIYNISDFNNIKYTTTWPANWNADKKICPAKLPTSDLNTHIDTTPISEQDRPSQINFRTANQLNHQISPGINLSGLSDDLGQCEGYFGWVIQNDAVLTDIKNLGFKSVRLTVNWSRYPKNVDESYQDTTDYSVFIPPSDQFFWRVKEIVCGILSKGMICILNHHPKGKRFNYLHMNQISQLWKWLAQRFARFPDSLIFEIFNEPLNANDVYFGGEPYNRQRDYNELFKDQLKWTIDDIRKFNPKRTVMVGGINWNKLETLLEIKNLLSPFGHDNSYIIYTFHWYDPFTLTHACAFYDGSNLILDSAVRYTIDKFRELRNSVGDSTAINVGEFGLTIIKNFSTYYPGYDANKCPQVIPLNVRLEWIRAVLYACSQNNFSFNYFDFNGYMGGGNVDLQGFALKHYAMYKQNIPDGYSYEGTQEIINALMEFKKTQCCK